jgi:drug/metabolite transporter (DMT)-like permease
MVISQSFAKECQEKGMNVFDLAFLRTFVNFIIAGIIVKASGNNFFGFSWAQTPFLVLQSFIGLTNYICLLTGCKLLPIFLANIILNTCPFWAALLAFLILSEKIKCVDIICMVGCFTGVIILALAPAPTAVTIGEHKNTSKMIR